MRAHKKTKTERNLKKYENYNNNSYSNDLKYSSKTDSKRQNYFYNKNNNLVNNQNKFNSNRTKSNNIYKHKNSSTSKVLSNILDEKKKFNIYSPSQLKQIIDEIKIIESQKKLENSNISKNYSISEDEEKNIYLIESLSNCLLQINNSNPKFIEMDINSKVLYLIHFINNENMKIRLGTMILEYFLLKNNFDYIEPIIKNDILQNILNYLHNSYESQEELYLVSCLNILSLYNTNYEYLVDSISLIAMFLTDFNYPYLQRASFICLIKLGNIGLQTLINISLKEQYQDYQKYILNSLIKTPYIKRLCIAKSLINELKSNEIDRRLEALCALNRFYDILDDEDLLNEISIKLNDEKFKNYQLYLVSILKCAGMNGLHYLIENLERSDNSKIREIICKVLGYRSMKKPNYLEIILDNNDVQSNSFIPIGKLWKYYGEKEPIYCENYNSNNNIEEDDLDSIEFIYNDNEINKSKDNKKLYINDFLLVNTRDFLTSLQRLMDENIIHNNIQIVNNFEKLNILDELDISMLLDKENNDNKDDNKEEFKIKLIDSISQRINISIFHQYKDIFFQNNYKLNDDNNSEYYQIDKNVIKFLCYHLNDYDEKVRLESAISLGKISLPEGRACIDEIIKVIDIEKNIDVLSAMLWALGKNLDPSLIELIPILIKYIQSNIWKVKRNSIFALSKYGVVAAEESIQILSKLLTESPMNKTIIAEAMVSMGNLGEEKLLEIIDKNHNYSNNKNDKLISAIVKSFSYINLNSSNIDKIIEFLCYQLNKSLSPTIRKNCLYSLRKLSNRLTKNNPNINFNENKENNNFIYLSEKNLIPIFYEKLKDKEFEIQKYAIDCILEFGPKGELIFIEGLLKDKSPIVRCNCAIGLCLFGVHTLRTLINKGLFDINPSVRTNIQRAILHFFNVDDIIKYYKEKGQLLSLKILLDEYLSKGVDITLDFFKFAEFLLDKIMNIINQ